MVIEKEYKELVKYTPQQEGNVILEREFCKKGACFIYGGANHVRLTEDTYFYTLSEFIDGKKQIIVNDHPLMRKSYSKLLKDFRGNILIGGLGLGQVLFYIKTYKSIDIVEKNPDVIKIIAPYFSGMENVNIIEQDIWDFVPTKKYDFVFEDFLWEDSEKPQREKFDNKLYANKTVHWEI